MLYRASKTDCDVLCLKAALLPEGSGPQGAAVNL